MTKYKSQDDKNYIIDKYYHEINDFNINEFYNFYDKNFYDKNYYDKLNWYEFNIQNAANNCDDIVQLTLSDRPELKTIELEWSFDQLKLWFIELIQKLFNILTIMILNISRLKPWFIELSQKLFNILTIMILDLGKKCEYLEYVIIEINENLKKYILR